MMPDNARKEIRFPATTAGIFWGRCSLEAVAKDVVRSDTVCNIGFEKGPDDKVDNLMEIISDVVPEKSVWH